MKKLFYLLLSVCLFCACSEEPEQTQDYTSFTITLNVETNVFGDTKTGYFNDAGECILLGEHGTLKPGVTTDEFIMSEFHESIYLFYENSDYVRLEKPFTIKKNQKNNIILSEDKPVKAIRIIEKTIYNWPH